MDFRLEAPHVVCMWRGYIAWGVVTLAAACGVAHGKVAPTSLRGLVVSSDVIVLARVGRVETIEGVRVPVLQVERTLKGPEAKEWPLLRTSRWVCDISTAVPGERGLFFLEPYRVGPEDTLKIPLPRFQDLVAARGLGALHGITTFGRGRMPLRVVQGEDHLAYYTWDVAMPPELEAAMVETPSKRDPGWQRSVPLRETLRWVEGAIAEVSASLTPAPPSR